MFLGEAPQGNIFGGKHVKGILHSDDEIAPFTKGAKMGKCHFFSDSSVNVTGGVGVFAGACIQPLSLRQHLESPNSHTSEMVAAGTNVTHILPVNGALQELGVRRGKPTRTYFDSASTVFVANS